MEMIPMAGRPRTMARTVAQLYDRYAAVRDELQRLMPQQYRKATTDSLGQTWQKAVDSLSAADDYFMDLSSFLDFKADKAEERAAQMAPKTAHEGALG